MDLKTESVQDLTWLAKLSEKEWETVKKRIPELSAIAREDWVKFARIAKKEL